VGSNKQQQFGHQFEEAGIVSKIEIELMRLTSLMSTVDFARSFKRVKVGARVRAGPPCCWRCFKCHTLRAGLHDHISLMNAMAEASSLGLPL
jgi:hypothetical protein